MATLVGGALFAFLALVEALAECPPGSGCDRDFPRHVLAPGTIAALLTFVATRAIVGWRQRRKDAA